MYSIWMPPERHLEIVQDRQWYPEPVLEIFILNGLFDNTFYTSVVEINMFQQVSLTNALKQHCGAIFIIVILCLNCNCNYTWSFQYISYCFSKLITHDFLFYFFHKTEKKSWMTSILNNFSTVFSQSWMTSVLNNFFDCIFSIYIHHPTHQPPSLFRNKT